MAANTDDLQLVTIEPEHFAALEQLQIDCYPTLDPRELMRVPQFESQHKVFPEGQIVAILPDSPELSAAPCCPQGRVVGQGSGFFIDFNFDDPGHTFLEIVDNNFFRNHNPQGDYYYGADISTHPCARGRGIGKALYQARKDLVIRHHKEGIVAGGLIPDYAHHKHKLSPSDYVNKVVAGELTDSTLTFQLRNGFKVRGILQDYLIDEASNNWATLIEWRNPAST
ncbi:GNAT family N-acetyltransferase [Mucisphaera sp.]|uniref:GNAT family N-acetyltransferase n=1 Tax=Mucisphaera sp. TaxID=2913024 RepID=UPI003D11194D